MKTGVINNNNNKIQIYKYKRKEIETAKKRSNI